MWSTPEGPAQRRRPSTRCAARPTASARTRSDDPRRQRNPLSTRHPRDPPRPWVLDSGRSHRASSRLRTVPSQWLDGTLLAVESGQTTWPPSRVPDGRRTANIYDVTTYIVARRYCGCARSRFRRLATVTLRRVRPEDPGELFASLWRAGGSRHGSPLETPRARRRYATSSRCFAEGARSPTPR